MHLYIRRARGVGLPSQYRVFSLWKGKRKKTTEWLLLALLQPRAVANAMLDPSACPPDPIRSLIHSKRRLTDKNIVTTQMRVLLGWFLPVWLGWRTCTFPWLISSIWHQLSKSYAKKSGALTDCWIHLFFSWMYVVLQETLSCKSRNMLSNFNQHFAEEKEIQASEAPFVITWTSEIRRGRMQKD